MILSLCPIRPFKSYKIDAAARLAHMLLLYIKHKLYIVGVLINCIKSQLGNIEPYNLFYVAFRYVIDLPMEITVVFRFSVLLTKSVVVVIRI